MKTWQKIKYLGIPLTNGSCMHEEIKSRLNSGKVSYHLVQNLLSSHLLPKSITIKTHTTTILSFVLYECEIWPFTIREESWLRVFEKWVLRKIFGFKRKYISGGQRKLRNDLLHDLYSAPNIIQKIISRRMRYKGHVAQIKENKNTCRV